MTASERAELKRRIDEARRRQIAAIKEAPPALIRPVFRYATEEERLAARRASWRKSGRKKYEQAKDEAARLGVSVKAIWSGQHRRELAA